MATTPGNPGPTRRRAASRPASARPAQGRAPQNRPAQARGAARGGAWRRLRQAVADFHWRRWMAVFICVAVLLVGVPLAHALVGDLGALLLLVGLGGFALGRSTARVGAVAPRRGKGR
jgi:hypothetical protein